MKNTHRAKQPPPSVGLVGIEGYGRIHLAQLQTLSRQGHCRLVVVADALIEPSDPIASGLNAPGIAFYPSAEDLLRHADVEAVFIATPIFLHARQSIDALLSGRHVYLEKPPCVSMAEWHRMDDAQTASGKICTVGFQMQTCPALHFLKDHLVKNTLGSLQQIWSSVRWSRTDGYYSRSSWAGRNWRQGSPVFDGPATNALSHVVQGSLFLAGNEKNSWPVVKRVRGSLFRARPLESYDSIFAEVEVESGARLEWAFTHATQRTDDVLIQCRCSEGYATLTWNGTVTLQRDGGALQEYTFVHEPEWAAALDFLQALRPAEAAGEVAMPLSATRPYVEVMDTILRGEIHDFAPEIIRYQARADHEGFYHVDGLDEQMAAYAHDSRERPRLLESTNAPWQSVPRQTEEALTGAFHRQEHPVGVTA